MTRTNPRLDLTRTQILAFRRHVGALDQRLAAGPRSLQRAAWAGLQDSMPRAAVLSIHARVEGTEPATWEDPSLAQLWGPRSARPNRTRAAAPQRRLVFPAPGGRPGAPGPRRSSPPRALDLARLAGRAPGRR